MALNSRVKTLWDDLITLKTYLNEKTKSRYKRINPFVEDLFGWKQHGVLWLDEDRNITIYNSTTINGNVDIGKNSWIGPFCSLDGVGGLIVGEHCSVSLGCQLVTHDAKKWAVSRGKEDYEYAPIHIGDCCYLGSYVVVCMGVNIGHNSIIGAGAVVTKNIEPYSIAVGVPARKIGTVNISEDGTVTLQYYDKK